MALASQTDWINSLAGVQLEVRQGAARSVTYPVDGIDFLIGSVPGCDLRVPGEPSLLCLIARHTAGATLRKLAPTQTILVNGHGVSHCEINDGDRIEIGALQIEVGVAAAPTLQMPVSPGSDPTKDEFQKAVAQFREKVVLFQKEKDAFEQQKHLAPPASSGAGWDSQRAQLQTELDERALEIDRQQRELVKVRQEMADLRRQLYDHYQERRERLTGMQDDLDRTRRDIEEREKKLRLEEQDTADSRQRDRQRQEELDRRTVEITQRSLRFDDERKLFEQRQRESLADFSRKNADLESREKAVADASRALDAKVKQYEADVVRFSRREGELEQREAELQKQSEAILRSRDTLDREAADFEAQVVQADEWRANLADEAERLKKQKTEQDQIQRQLDERTASLEGQQASLAVLRNRLERMREETRSREPELDAQRAELDARAAALEQKQAEIDKNYAEMEADKALYAKNREQFVERGAIMDAAVRQLQTAQDELLAEKERVRLETKANDECVRQLAEAESILQSRLGQLAEAQNRLELERTALRDRGAQLLEREAACQTLQEQLHSRTEEIAARAKDITERLSQQQAKLDGLDDRAKQLDQRELELNRQIEVWRLELEQKAQSLQQRHVQVAGVEGAQQEQLNQVALERKALLEERAQFQLEQRAALEKFAQARTELEALRRDALATIEQLPDAELRAGTAVERLGNARAQLRNHLAEVHQYVRQCHDELAQLRTRLQADLDKLITQEESLRRNQDEHRLAATAFRQQLIDWQAQFGELQRLLARDETRLERREAKTEERARAIEAESARLAQQAEVLQEQERDVADRRDEMDRHLGDMRDWYRKKLRELAGIPLVPLSSPSGTEAGGEGEPVSIPMPPPVATGNSTDDEAGIVPTERSILSIADAAEPGDRQLGQTLREAQLIDADTLTALLAESRRQRRSLRQVLLASGVITLYQLALIEAGNVDGLMLGPVRIVDRLRNTAHEAVYRVFDPRRGVEAVLRHLSEADMADAVRPDEFRQRFTQAKLNDIHVANTLEVLELSDRPAALQEWLTGLPATDWPPLAAAPGVCYRLLTQAAQGLAAIHQAGAVHGHLADSLLLLTADGVLKLCGLGEPPWLIGMQQDDEPTAKGDLRTLGKIASGWCTPTGVRKGAKTKPLPDALVSILYRLAADGDAGYRDVKELLEDLEKASSAIPPNAEAWDRLVKYVRENAAAEASLRQSA